MAYVVTKACLGVKQKACVEVCPVDCFFDIRKKELNEKYGIATDVNDGDEDAGMLMINPDECINCGACESECPVSAIYEDSSIPDDLKEFIELNEKETTSLSDEEMEKLRCVPS